MRVTYIFLWLIFAGFYANAQTFSKQTLNFALTDKAGNAYPEETIVNGTVKIYSLRDAKVSKNPQLGFNKTTNLFTFSEETYSPGVSLAFVSPTDTMYLEVYGRSAAHRVINAINIQRGSYTLTSNNFSGSKTLKISDWHPFVTDEVPVAEQNMAAYAKELIGKKPVPYIPTINTN